jgi:hypothetical protein
MVLVPFSAVRVEAVTIREIIELSQAGLGEEVLLALIEVDQRVFSIDPATLRELKAAGVSERVIVAMVRSGRTRPPDPSIPASVTDEDPPPPQVIVIDHEPAVREVAVPVAVPVYIPVVQRVRRGHREVPVNPAVPLEVLPVGSFPLQPRRVSPSPPVYWGWGGKLRPDAWKPAPQDTARPPHK